MNQFAEFNHFVNSPIAVYKDELYNLPFNMNTFHQLWGVRTPAEAEAKIREQISRMHITNPRNLEEQALALVGQDVYEKLIEGYTRKQWGRECRELPAFIIKRLPLRYTYDNNYFKDPYQGIPKGGYTEIIRKLLEGTQVILKIDFLQIKRSFALRQKKWCLQVCWMSFMITATALWIIVLSGLRQKCWIWLIIREMQW